MPPKATVSGSGWKTGEQLEYLLSCWENFKRAQTNKKLDRFWGQTYEEWYKRWPVPSPASWVQDYGSVEAGRFMYRKEKDGKIKQWFNNRCRGSDSAKMGRGELKLDFNEKRKLAAVQAYCSYAWDAGLRDIVLTRWEQQKKSDTFDDEDDPSDEAVGQEGAIPLSFKLKIAKEVYDGLPQQEKRQIDKRRENDRERMYFRVTQLPDDERIKKLQTHQRNQPMVAKSLLRVLMNLENQAGCVAQVLVASVDPTGGPPSIQKFCQGETQHGSNFETFYGVEWEKNVEEKFREWAVRAYGEKGTKRRNKFLLKDDPVTIPEAGPDTAPEASSSQTASTGVASSQNSHQPSRSQGSQESLPQPSTTEGSAPLPPTPAPPVTHASVNQSSSRAATTEAAQPPLLPTPRNIGTVEPSQVSISPPQLSVSTPQVVTLPHVVVEPPQPVSDPVTSQAGALSANPQSDLATNVTSSAPTPKTRYRVRNPKTTSSTTSSRRDSIIGAPEIIVDTVDGGQDIIVDLTGLISFEGDDQVSHVSSSQKTADGSRELSPPPVEPQQPRATADQSVPIRTFPQLDIDNKDLPSWMVKKGQWKYVVSTAGGTAWENLLRVYIDQERRLEFTEMGATLTVEDRPSKIKEYFQYAHQPSRGDTLKLPDFGTEVTKWWEKIQPDWRRSNQNPPQTPGQWSYILSGGSKGAFLLILCLAWWDRAYERQRTSDLPAYDTEWLKIVSDVTFVMQKAQTSDVPTRGVPVKRKREVEPPTPRKRSTPSRAKAKA